MVELTTLNVLKKGENSFVPKIKPKILSINARRTDKNNDIHNQQELDPFKSKKPSSIDEKSHIRNGMSESSTTDLDTDGSRFANVYNHDYLDTDVNTLNNLDHTDAKLELLSTIYTSNTQACVDSIPSITTLAQDRPPIDNFQIPSILSPEQVTSTTTRIISNNLTPFYEPTVIPTITSIKPDITYGTLACNKKPIIPNNRKSNNTALDSSLIKSTPLNVLIKHKFKNGSLSKTELKRIRTTAESKTHLKRNITEECSESPSSTNSDVSTIQFNTPVLEKKVAVPRLVMVDGRIRLDHSSLLLRRQEADANLEEIDEGAQRLVTSSTFLASRYNKKIKWTKDLTDKFYEGLSYFGTDFSLISVLLQGIDRRQIKSKFNIEEKKNIRRLNAALKNKRPLKEIADVLRQNLIFKKARSPQDSQSDDN